MKNYEEKIEAMRKELNKKERVAQILQKLQRDMEWDAMKRVEDDSEEGYHFEELNEDDWYYNDFLAYKEAIEVLEKHFFGK